MIELKERLNRLEQAVADELKDEFKKRAALQESPIRKRYKTKKAAARHLVDMLMSRHFGNHVVISVYGRNQKRAVVRRREGLELLVNGQPPCRFANSWYGELALSKALAYLFRGARWIELQFMYVEDSARHEGLRYIFNFL